MRLRILSFALFLTPLLWSETPVVHTSSGFSFQPPAGWVVASKDQTAAAKAVAEKWIAKAGNIDLSKVAVAVFNPEETSFVTNINVIVMPNRPPTFDANTAAQYGSSLQRGFEQLGLKVTSFSARTSTAGKHTILLADYRIALPNGSLIRQWQAVFAGSQRGYVVTCSASDKAFLQVEKSFRATLASMDLEDYRP